MIKCDLRPANLTMPPARFEQLAESAVTEASVAVTAAVKAAQKGPFGIVNLTGSRTRSTERAVRL